MAKSLREGEIEELKSRCDMQTIISGYVNLKKAGKNYTGLCPFHKEKTPSFTVDPRKQLYHCFGCGEGGDIISFIMKIENLDFIESAELLAKKVNYSLRYIQSGGAEKSEKRSRIIDANELAKKFYNYVLFNSKNAAKILAYLKKRGFNDEVLKKFEVGYSPESWRSFSDFALKRRFTSKELKESGLAIESSRKKDEVYDRFRGRIMFPIKDVVGRTVGFGGRRTEEGSSSSAKSPANLQSAKYINTPETKVYSKSRNIYGLFESKNSIIESDRALVVEGYTDVVALHQSGINNAVASLGTALTAEQVELLGRFTKNVTLVFDSDAAGQSASLRGIERLKEYNERLDLYREGNIDMRITVLEEGFDPADYILKKGKEAFLEKVSSSVSMIDFTIDTVLKKYNLENLSHRLRAADELMEFVSSLSSKIMQEEVIKKISGKLNMAENLLIEQLLKKMQKKTLHTLQEVQAQSAGYDVSPARNIEVEALKILINGIGEKFSELLEIGQEYFRFEETKKLYLILRDIINRENRASLNFPVQISSDMLEEEPVKKLYNLIIFSPVNYSDYSLASREVYNNLKRIYITDRIGEINIQLKKMENYLKSLTKMEASEELIIKRQKVEKRIKELTLKLNDLEVEKRSFAS